MSRPISMGSQSGRAPETATPPLPLSGVKHEGKAMRPIDVREVIRIHFVMPDEEGEMFNAHTHGLEAYGHKEFQVLVPGFCASAAADILNNHADRVINQGEVFGPGDTGEIGKALCAYIEVPGDIPGEPTRLRIVDVSTWCFQACWAARN